MKRALTLILASSTLTGCASTPSRDQHEPSAPPSADVGRFVADRQPWSYKGAPGWEIAAIIAINGLVLLRHGENIKRLLGGSELSARKA